MEPPIHSTKSPVVHRFRRAAAGEEPGLMVAEGVRLVEEALAARLTLVEVAWSPRLTGRPAGAALLERLRERGARLLACTDRVLEQLSHLTTHQGISVLARRPEWGAEDLLGARGTAGLVVVAAGVRDPGNLGAIVRSAEASGATGLVAIEATADPYRDKALRGSAGSIFRLPCVVGWSSAAVITFARGHDLRLVAATADATADAPSDCWAIDLRSPTLLVLGAEAAGVPAPLLEAADDRIRIPLAGAVESLNVSVAAGILLFEARRQRAGAAR